MLYDEWMPIYREILTAFGYDLRGDERARDRLAALVDAGGTLTPDDIKLGETVAICGGADTLSSEINIARRADCVIAASVAADVCLEAGVPIDCMVTDLDKNPKTAIDLSERGVPVAVHAHGDNVDALERYLPHFELESVLPTTQAAPVSHVHNPGGFTDGDRAAFLADARGAARLLFPGWKFDDPGVTDEKASKLRWAERLLGYLERRRGERFELLDGRREAIDYPWEADPTN